MYIYVRTYVYICIVHVCVRTTNLSLCYVILSFRARTGIDDVMQLFQPWRCTQRTGE